MIYTRIHKLKCLKGQAGNINAQIRADLRPKSMLKFGKFWPKAIKFFLKKLVFWGKWLYLEVLWSRFL